MDSFFRSSSSKSHIPSSSNSSDNVVNNEEICIMDQELNLQEWKLSSVPTKNIYKQSTFSNLSFLLDYTIKTVERTVFLNKEYETIKLFSKDSIEKHKEKYSFIHIGLVQVAVKPLTRQGLNNSVKTETQQTDKTLQNDSEIKIEEIQDNNKAKQNSKDNNLFINLIDKIIFQKWCVEVTLIINDEFQITTVALIDSGADMNCIQE
jgi:hypothetical protein